MRSIVVLLAAARIAHAGEPPDRLATEARVAAAAGDCGAVAQKLVALAELEPKLRDAVLDDRAVAACVFPLAPKPAVEQQPSAGAIMMEQATAGTLVGFAELIGGATLGSVLHGAPRTNFAAGFAVEGIATTALVYWIGDTDVASGSLVATAMGAAVGGITGYAIVSADLGDGDLSPTKVIAGVVAVPLFAAIGNALTRREKRVHVVPTGAGLAVAGEF